MEERNSSVKGLRDYYQGIVESLKKENESFQQVKQNSTSVPPQRNSVNRESLQFNLQKFQPQKNKVDDVEKYLKIIEQLQNKIKYYEQRQDNNDFNNLQELYENQKHQIARLSEMNDQLNEDLISAHQTIANLENEIHKLQVLHQRQNSQTQEQKKEVIEQKKPKILLEDKEAQVDLLSPIVEQNKLLIERLHENPNPQGKQLIIINSAQSIELRRQMETLKLELVERLNQYNNYIQNKQLAQIKKSIKVDINQIYSTYIQMFYNINRPIQNVEQIGKILSPIYQDELNEFLGQLSDFLDKFRLVSIL